MRILIATGLYPPDIGGPATYTKMLEEHLPKHGIEPVVAPYGWVRRYPRIIRHLVYTWKLIREVTRCDLLYALDPISVGIPVYLAHVVTRKPYFLRVAGDYAWEQGQQRFGVTMTLDEFVEPEAWHPFFVRLLVKFERFVARRATHIIVPSAYMKRIVSAWGIDPTKITVVYSALHPLDVRETREEIRKMFGYKGLVLATAGRLVPWKGIAALIELLPVLCQSHKQVTLIVIGDGPLRGQLERLAKKLRMETHVRFVGSMPKDTLGAAIRGADVFVLNTGYEGFSHQLLEVMDLGIPVVTTDVGGNPELIEDGITGLLVDFNDKEALIKAIEKMAAGGQVPDGMVQRARLKTKAFEAHKVVGDLVVVLTEVIPDSKKLHKTQ